MNQVNPDYTNRKLERERNKRYVIVDADACPYLDGIINIARKHRTPVVLVGNETQNIRRFEGQAGVSTIEVPTGKDAADYAIVVLLKSGDIVITGDIGLAFLVLAKEASAISPRGKVFNPATIEAELYMRYEGQKVRRAGGKTKGPSKYTEEDKKRLTKALQLLLES